MPYWQDERYVHLLTPSIWGVSTKRIIDSILEYERLGLEKYIVPNSLRKSAWQIRALYNYCKAHDLEVVIDNKLHPIFAMSSSTLLEKCGIDLKYLVELEKKKEQRL